MRIVTFKRIQDFSKLYPDSDIALRNWHKTVSESDWSCFAEMKQTFGSVDNVGNSRFVFNIRGNAYRLIAIVIFASRKVYIRFIGTHKEYDKIKDCSTI
jgi:mRNA interferase HigB